MSIDDPSKEVWNIKPFLNGKKYSVFECNRRKNYFETKIVSNDVTIVPTYYSFIDNSQPKLFGPINQQQVIKDFTLNGIICMHDFVTRLSQAMRFSLLRWIDWVETGLYTNTPSRP